MVLGDDGPHVPGLHSVGDLAGLGAVEQQGHVGQIGEVLHRQIALPDLRALHIVDGDGVLVAVGNGHLLQQLLQGPLGLGGADEGVVHIQGVAMLHHAGPEGAVEDLLQLALIHHRAAEGEAGGVGHPAGLHGVVAADGVGDGPLHRQEGGLGLRLAGHGAQIHAVIGHGGGGGVEDLEHGENGDSQAGGKEDRRVDPLGLAGPPGPGDELRYGGADAVHQSPGPLAQQGHGAGQQQLELPVGAVGLRKPLPVPIAENPAGVAVPLGHDDAARPGVLGPLTAGLGLLAGRTLGRKPSAPGTLFSVSVVLESHSILRCCAQPRGRARTEPGACRGAGYNPA